MNVKLIPIYHSKRGRSSTFFRKISSKLDVGSSQVYDSAYTLGIGPQVSF